MKTIAELNALIPEIIAKLSENEHEIGTSSIERSEDGYGKNDEPTANYFTFEEDGWLVEVVYNCCGEWETSSGDYWNPPYCELKKAWGDAVEISASYYDEGAEEETAFSECDLRELKYAINQELRNIA